MENLKKSHYRRTAFVHDPGKFAKHHFHTREGRLKKLLDGLFGKTPKGNLLKSQGLIRPLIDGRGWNKSILEGLKQYEGLLTLEFSTAWRIASFETSWMRSMRSNSVAKFPLNTSRILAPPPLLEKITFEEIAKVCRRRDSQVVEWNIHRYCIHRIGKVEGVLSQELR